MNLDEFIRRRQIRNQQAKPLRQICHTCLQPDFGCYCRYSEKFDCNIKFVILIHPIESRKRIATGRLSHLHLENSHIIRGQEFGQNATVNRLIADKTRQKFILFPGTDSKHLKHPSDFTAIKRPDAGLTVFVIDGTWTTAGRTIRRSSNLARLPKIHFTPKSESSFRVRKQPNAECVSTIEAIHQCIELLGPSVGYNVESRHHDRLLASFDKMVTQQLDIIKRLGILKR